MTAAVESSLVKLRAISLALFAALHIA